MRTSFRYLVAALLAAGTLGGCSNDDDTSANGTTVSGIAATGAAISGGTVALRCNNGAGGSTTSASNGAWAAMVSSGDLPCAVRISGGTVNGFANAETFHALALAGSSSARTAHLTPLADLALASAVNSATGSSLETWFASATDAQRQQVANSLATAIAELDTALAAAGYTLPANFNPFTSAIVAGGVDDAYDLLLEAYKQALSDAGTSYADARADYTAGGDLPGTSTGGGTDEVSGPLTAPAASDAASFLAGLEGNYQLKVVEVSGTAAGEFELGKVYAVKFETGTNGSHSVSVTGATRTISHLYIQKTLSDYQAGATEALSFYDNVSNSCCQYYITYTPAEGHLTIEAAVGEGLVKLESKKGTPAVEPETPVTPAGSGLLGAILRDVFAGDYVLKCGRFGEPVKALAFSIGADGSSRFKGAPLIDTAHRGRIELEGGPKSSLLYLRFYPYASGSDTVALGFKSDGSFYPNVVISDGQTLTCYNNTGHSAPAVTAQAFSRIASVVGAQARTQTLNCTRNNMTQAQTLTIGSDGSAQVGSQSYSADHIASINDNILFGKTDNQTGTINYYDNGRSLGLSFRNEDVAGNGAVYGEGLGPDGSICQP